MTSEHPPRTGKLAYQPALDGMRAVALVGVLVAHAALVQSVLVLPASFMYVDLFFVISGYLITTLLLREAETTGRVSLKAFYVRRFARLYPVILLAVVIMVVTRLVSPDSPSTPSWLFITGATFYFANFAALINPLDGSSAWIPLWSLSIEEQFYAVWPAVLLIVVGRGRRTGRALLLVALLTVAMWIHRSWSFHHALHTDHLDASERFKALAHAWHSFEYSTFQRPDGILIGCALALILARPDRPSARLLIRLAPRLRPAALLVVVGIVAATTGGAAWQVYWGLAVFNICIALLIADLLTTRDSMLSRFLALRPFVWIGRRTYFMYVIHAAVYAFAFDVLGFTSLPAIALIVAFVFALSGVSYRFYEDPIRRWGYRTSTRIITSETPGIRAGPDDAEPEPSRD